MTRPGPRRRDGDRLSAAGWIVLPGASSLSIRLRTSRVSVAEQPAFGYGLRLSLFPPASSGAVGASMERAPWHTKCSNEWSAHAGGDMDDLGQDLRFAVRALAKNPGFTLVVVLTLALGIGANTAIFSLMDQILLRLLPVEEPERLVVLQRSRTLLGHREQPQQHDHPLFPPDVRGPPRQEHGLRRRARGVQDPRAPHGRQPDGERPRRPRLRQLLRGPRPHPRRRTALHARGRQDARAGIPSWCSATASGCGASAGIRAWSAGSWA